MILNSDNPLFDIAKHLPPFRGNPEPASGVECVPIGVNVANPSRVTVDWSGVRATSQRRNNLCPGYPGSDVRAWNSGYPQGILIGKKRRHVLMTQHYVSAVPSEAQWFTFMDSNGLLVKVKAEKIIWHAHHDTVLVRLVDPVPDNITSYPVCDVRYCKPDRQVWMRTCQGQSIRMSLETVSIQDNSPMFFTVKPWTNPDGSLGSSIEKIHSGDSGTPVLTVLRDGRTAYVGMLWGGGCISFGLPNRLQQGHDPLDWSYTSPHAAGFPRFQSVLSEIGDEIEVVYPDFDPCDLDSDGQVGPKDLALIQGAWGTPSYDVTGDGVVNALDMAGVLGQWGHKVDPAGLR